MIELKWINRRRLSESFTNATRLVFAGAVGGYAYRVTASEGSILFESGLFFSLVVMVAIIEYLLKTVEEGADDA